MCRSSPALLGMSSSGRVPAAQFVRRARVCVSRAEAHTNTPRPPSPSVTSQGISLGQAFGWELLMTFVLVITVYR